MKSPETIRIFISSPGDVAEERAKARQVVELLGRWYGERLTLQAVLWEDLPLQADTSFQEGIDLVLSEQNGMDIAIFILWSRLGSVVGGATRKPDGSHYRSGTEREFDLMLMARAQSQGKRPQILAYCRDDPDGFLKRMGGEHPKGTDALGEMIRQRGLAEQFVRERFHDEQGRNLRAYHSYREPVTFAQRLKAHLRELLEDRLGESNSPLEMWSDAPYRGLQVFDVAHAPIFFGREEETLGIETLLRRRATEEHCAFAVIVGPSGSGKSSLARAGVASELLRQNLDDTVRQWRCAIFTPAQSQGRLIHGLVRSLEAALKELRNRSGENDTLAETFQTAPETATGLALKAALADAAGTVGGPVRILLILDQLEELYTDSRLSDAEREVFLRAVESLARSGGVWVLATLRSDFYPIAQSSRTFLRLKGATGQVDLSPPGASAVQRLISGPARRAGLHFERPEGGRKPLDEELLDDAQKLGDALPLIEDALRELYDRRNGGRTLTFASYRQMGGVEGALGRRAEAVFFGLSPEVQKVFEQIAPALVAVSSGPEDRVVRRHAQTSVLTDTPEKKALVESLIRERLLTAHEQEGHSTVALAHEILFHAWPRLAGWIREHHDFLRLRANLERDCQRWSNADRKHRRTLLLPHGLKLDEGRQFLRQAARFGGEDNQPLARYVRASLQRWTLIRVGWAGGILAGLILAIAATSYTISHRLGILIVTSEPPGAKISVEGKEWGVTPYASYFVRPRPVALTLVKDGFAAQTVQASVRAGLPFEVNVPLTKGGDIGSKVSMSLGNVTVVAIQGDVRVQRKQSATADPAVTDMVLQDGDRIHTGKNSRATIRRATGEAFLLDELTTTEVRSDSEKPENGLRQLLRGTLYFFGKEAGFEFKTQTVGLTRG